MILVLFFGMSVSAWADVTKSTWDGKVPSTANVSKTVCNDIGINGSGTEADPYIISTAQHFAYFASKMNSNTNWWKLADNVEIDLDGTNHAWTYGQSNANFKGHFDGNKENGSFISNMKFVTNGANKSLGLFPQIQGSGATNHTEVKNLEIKNFQITTPGSGTSYGGTTNVGLLIGKVNGNADVVNVTITGTNSISYDVTTTGANYVGALAGNVTSDNCTVKNCTISGVSVTTDAAAVKKDFYLGGLAGYVSNNSVITDNTVSSLSITLNGNTNGNNIIGGLIGYVKGTNSTVADKLPMGKRTLVQKNTVTSPTITMNGSVEVKNFELGGLIGWIGSNTNVFNNKVISPNISLKNNINAETYVGGAVGFQDGYTFVDGLTVCGTSTTKPSITGPTSDKTLKNNIVFFVGGYLGYMQSSGVNAFQATKFKNIAVTGMNINLGHYKPGSSIQNHKFSVGGIAGSINAPNMTADGKWGGMPENLIFKGGKIYAPWASTSPTVSNFNAGAAAHNNMTPDVVTTVDAIEKAKVNTWYYNDYKLGLSSEYLTSESVKDQGTTPKQFEFRKNYSAEPAEDGGIKYLAINNSTFAKSNRYQDSERDSKTVLWWTQQASMDKSKGSVAAVTCFTANEQPIYPQSGATSAQAGNLTDYPHYMYFFQGVSNAKWASNDDAGKIVDGIEANFTNNILPAIATVPEASASVKTVTITNDGETRRGFDNRTLTVSVKNGDTDVTTNYTYQWYVDGKAADGTGTTKTLTPHWKDSKGITVNVLSGTTVVATASYGFGPGVLHTKKSQADATAEKIRSDINGRGTSANPYIIDSESALRQLSYLSTAHTNTRWETVSAPASPYPTNQPQGHYNRAYYKLGADINLNNTDFTPISHVGYGSDGSWGTYSTNWIFQGVFDGAGYTISNFNITWGASQYVGNGSNIYYGLFGAVGNATAARKWGDSADGNTVIKNLIISGATLKHNTAETSFYYDQSISTNANYALVGVLAGVVTSNTTIQNIEIRDSKIIDSGSNDYSLATKGLYVGGAIGAVQAAYNATTNVPANTQIQHIAAKVDITLTKPVIVKTSDATQTGSFNVGGIIGRYVATGASKEQVELTLPKYTIYSGTIDAAKAWISPVVASLRYKDQNGFNFNNYSKHWEGNNNTAATQVTINNALYYNFYIGANKITDTYPSNTCALGSRTMTAHTNGTDAAGTYSAQKYQGVNYGARYVDAENASLELLNGAPFDGYNWVWSDGFPHMSTAPYVEARISRVGDTFTATLVGAEATRYKWQASFDGEHWNNISSATDATYAAPKSLKPKYIVAFVNNEYRTLVELVEPNEDLIKPTVTKSGETYTFAAGNTVDIPHLQVINEWYYTKADAENDGKSAEATTASWTPTQANIVGGIVWCKVIVKELDVTVYKDLIISGATVVFVKGDGGHDNGEDNGDGGTYSGRGWTPGEPVKTIDHANSLLKSVAQGGTVDNNIIVVMGVLNPQNIDVQTVKRDTYVLPFQSKGKNPATITGKYENTDYHGEIVLCEYWTGNKEENVNTYETLGHNCYVLADTKFENLTFRGTPNGNSFIECHGNDVTFGKGLVMTGFANLTKNHGNFGGNQIIPEFTIILTATNLSEDDIKKYTQNREKPQVVTFQSGHYGRLMGGRFTQGFFSESGNTAHTILGSAANPVWAVVNIDIDNDNDNHKNAYVLKNADNLPATSGNYDYTCDINALIAGLTDGTMYGDYTINFHGGTVSYIVGGNQGNPVPNGNLDFVPDGGVAGKSSAKEVAWGQWPNASYFGRTVINVEQDKELKNITVGNLYAGGLGRQANGSNAKSIVDMYFYGHTEVNVKSGTVGSVYGGGAGGVMGVNPWDAHLPYATNESYSKDNAIINNVQYGDEKYGTWSTQKRGKGMATVKLHKLNDAGTGYVEDAPLDLSKSYTTVNIMGGTVNGSIYGGGYGHVDDMPADVTMQGIGSVFGETNINITGGYIRDNVYGGSQGKSTFYNQKNFYGQTINHIAEMNGTVNLSISGTEDHYPTINGNIFGAGAGLETVTDRKATQADVDDLKPGATAVGATYTEEYADIARTGNIKLEPTNGTYKSVININIDLPEIGKPEDADYLTKQPLKGNIYGGGENGKVDGEININIKNGVINGNVFGAGLGEAGHTETKAMVTGNTYVNMFNAKVNASDIAGTGNVYGGGQLGKVLGNTNVNMEDGVIQNNVFGGGREGTVSAMAKVTLNGSHIHGNVFGGGDKAVVGTAATGDQLTAGDARKAWAAANGTYVEMSGDNARVFGDIFGGGNEATVQGNTTVNLHAGEFGGNVFGGGNGTLGSNYIPTAYADVTNNVSVYLEGANVMWNRMWDTNTKQVIEWDGTWNGTNRAYFVTGTESNPVFLNAHNVYGGGNRACRVTGDANVFVVKGFANAPLLNTDVWKNSFYDNNNPHFYVFGGGYGPFTKVTNTYVNVGVEGVYEDATTIEQLAKPAVNMAKAMPGKKKTGVASASHAGEDDASIGVYDNSFGIPYYTVLGVLGGGYSGLISGNTNVTVGGETFIHRVYGGGYGSATDYGTLQASVKAQQILGGEDSRELRNILGEVAGKTDVTVNGAFIYGDVFGGGAGVESAKNASGEATLDYVDMARVHGNDVPTTQSITKVTVSDNAKIYGSVYGGGDIANVGKKDAAAATGEPTYTPANGDTPASLSNVTSFVNIIGGDVFGEVFGGGGGRQHYSINAAGNGWIQTTAVNDVLGRIEGNTLVHIANTPAGQTLTGEDEEPNIWQRIYGGGNLGSVNGSAKVWVEGGNIGYNIIGGGNGYAADDTPSSQTHGTYANIYRNTTTIIDGGSVIWDKAADAQGNVTTWTDATKQLISTEKEMRDLFLTDPELLGQMVYPHLDKRFFYAESGDNSNVKFPINHNIYGGGRYACNVSGTSTVTLNHSLITDEKFLDIRTVAGLCWYSIVNNTSEPQFSVFAGGFGANTKVAKTVMNVQIGTAANYAAKAQDKAAWDAYEAKLQTEWANVTNDEKINLYGGTNENAYRRYRTSRYALSLGVPSHTYMNVYGGGYSGYVTGNTDVNISGTSGIRNVYGGGLGAYRDRSIAHTLQDGKLVEAPLTSELTYGSVGGNTDVYIKGGIISLNVYGGGAGVESKMLNDALTYTDFPLMAHVAGKTKVNITGSVTEENGHQLDGTIVYGKVFGGGDVANVGDVTKKDKEDGDNAMVAGIEWINESGVVASEATDDDAYTSDVTVQGGLVMSQVLAGGSGRTSTECADYTQLGSIYGNSRVTITNNTKNAAWSPWIWNSIYGGGENGTVYGNSIVQIQGGYIGYNIFGGGWGLVDGEHKSEANIARNSFVNVTGGEYVLTQIWNADTRTWYRNNQRNSPQFDYDTKKFLINHNIYGGGNMACTVGGSTYVKMTKGLLKNTTKVSYDNGIDYNLFNSDEWRDVYNKTGSPHFSVYGGGFGADTNIKGGTNIDIALHGTTNKTIAEANSSTGGEDDLSRLFYSEQAVMDITGGGYSGSVTGKAHVKIAGDTFARRILGGGFYGSVGETLIDITSVDCNDIFGGGLMGDIGIKQQTAPTGAALTSGNGVARINLGTNNSATNSNIWVHKNIYGANDVSGSIYSAANIYIYGGNFLGNVYGAGNGDYLYAQGDKNTKQVMVNEYYKTAETTYDLVYTVPSDRLTSAIASAPEAAKMVNVNSYRPATQNVSINLSGSVASPVRIDGNVFGGGNSATVNEIYAGVKPDVKINLGNYLTIGGVYLGCDGDAMFDDKTNYMNAYQEVNKIDLTHTIDWVDNPGNVAVPYQYLPVKPDDRRKIYKTNLDLYFQPVEMAVQPTVTWDVALNDAANGHTTIGTFVCGGNRGNMNVTPDNNGKIVDITFPAGLTILQKIVGGCNNANISYKNTHHEGGYLLGKRNETAADNSGNNDIALTVKCQFLPQIGDSGLKEGGNVYGGCYKSGTINGDVFIDVQTNMLVNITKDELNASKAKDGVALGNVYGAGYGNDSYVYGNTTILFGKGVSKDSVFVTSLTSSQAKSVRTSDGPAPAPTPVVVNGAAVNNIFGGGQQGNLIGNSLVRIYNGRVTSSVCGGSYAGYMWGSTQVLVGYPKYYTCKQSGIYNLKRADKWNTSYKNYDASEVIKQKIYLMKGDVVSEEVYEATAPVLSSDELSAAFSALKTTAPSDASLTWDNIDITIDDAVYGGGYSLASGSSVAAGTYTVKKYNDVQNLNDELAASDPTTLDALNTANNNNGTKGFGGNTTVLVWDRAAAPTDGSFDKDHIAISTQSMREVHPANGTDLFGYYYNDNGRYRYIYQEDTYFYGSGTDGKTYYANAWESDSEGGMYGDGHLSFAEGFRAGEINGYGFSGANPNGAKLINTFQRMDILRVQDCSLALLGARDYTVTELSTTPYSIARVGELQMRATSNVKVGDGTTTYLPVTGDIPVAFANGQLLPTTNVRSRNYIGFSNNIHYIGAIDSDVPFTDTYHYGNKDTETFGHENGKVGATSYRAEKQKYIDAYKKDKVEASFQKRNDGTAKNMIGIASGYAMKLQNVYTTDDKNTEDIFYGPIVGVVEINLIHVREDEGGGYVYADNIHHRKSAHTIDVDDTGDQLVVTPGKDADEDFLETSGNFVFPYDKSRNRYIVDDCFPVNYYINNTGGTGYADISRDKGIHYWYVTGFNYYYNAHITGYTYDSSTTPLYFNNDNKDGLLLLSGTKAGQTVTLQSLKWRSNHFNTPLYYEEDEIVEIDHKTYVKSTCEKTTGIGGEVTYIARANSIEAKVGDLKMDNNGFVACDIENTSSQMTTACASETVKGQGNTKNSDGVYDHYNLSISAPGAKTTEDIGIQQPNKAIGVYSTTEAHIANLPMNNDDAVTFGSKDLSPEISSASNDPAITLQLKDQVNNEGNNYYKKYMAQPCKATLVLTAPAIAERKATQADVEAGKATAVDQMIMAPVHGYVPIQYFFTRSGDVGNYTYTRVADKADITHGSEQYYYFGNGNEYHPVNLSELKIYDQENSEYETPTEIVSGGDAIYYVDAERIFTYTIYLTIDYVLGPSYTGNLKVHNCALPGEMIKIDKGNIQLTGDQTFSQSGTTYKFGKRVKVDDKWQFVNDANYPVYNYNVEAEGSSDMLKDVRYDKDGDYILVPAYYFMNGYGVQYSFKVNNLDTEFPVEIADANTLLIHNYHRMQPRSSSGEDQVLDQHLDLAAKRHQLETEANEANPLPEPRIYLVDSRDLNKFGTFLDEKAAGSDEIGSKYNSGENMQFFLQRDIYAIKPGDKEGGVELTPYVAPQNFKGTLHGDGHIITGLDRMDDAKYLLTANAGNIYNLGLTTGVITKGDAVETPTNNSHYHCCYTYNPATVPDASASVPHVVYRMDGTAFTGYTDNDWRYGKVAYDLNQYYLDKRYVLGAQGSESSAANYVENYYANGDYLYADYSAANHYNGSEFLRTAARPNYGEPASLHDATHTIDQNRAVGYEAAVAESGTPGDAGYVPATPASCTGYQPLFDAAKVSDSSPVAETAVKNDYIFWGQRQNSGTKGAALGVINNTLPANITADLDLTYAKSVHLVSDMATRVYRAAGYYGSIINNGYYYNQDGYAHNNTVTAIDFFGYNDWSGTPKTKTFSVGGNIGGSVGTATGDAVTFYAPVADYGLHSFAVDNGVTRNLLLYAGSEHDVTPSGALSSFVYGEDTPEDNIRAHAISVDGEDAAATPQAEYLHLVERAADNLQAAPSKQYINDFCAPVQFAVTNRAWYTRKPMGYAESNNDAWEGICLPFTVNKTVASLNGEITHFYGADPTSDELADPTKNVHTLHHEYWLRGLVNVTKDDATTTACFQRPGSGEGLFNSGTVIDTYTFDNRFFPETYNAKYYNSTDNRWYEETHQFDGYMPLTSSVPYVVSFPGNRFYEFDLSSKFYNSIFDSDLLPQTVTFNAYGPDSEDANRYATNIIVPQTVVSNLQTTLVGVNYAHAGTYQTITADDIYGINDAGTAFTKADNTVVLPFRTYMKQTAASPAKQSVAQAKNIVIGSYVAPAVKEEIQSNYGDDPDKDITDDGFAIYSKGNRIFVRSTYSTALHVYNLSGRLMRVLDVRSGTNTYSGFPQGLYIVGNKKLYVR